MFQKEAKCIIFAHQDFHDGDTLINIYTLNQWCIITTEDDRHLFLSGGIVEECVEVVEAEEVEEEVVELINLAVLDEDEVGLEIQFIPNDYANDPAPENVPASTNQGEVVYNVDWGHDENFRRRLTGARNHNLCVHFSPDIDLTKLQLFQMFLFRDFI